MHDLTSLGIVEALFVGTHDQLADLNTKALARLKLSALTQKLNLVEHESCKAEAPKMFTAFESGCSHSPPQRSACFASIVALEPCQ